MGSPDAPFTFSQRPLPPGLSSEADELHRAQDVPLRDARQLRVQRFWLF